MSTPCADYSNKSSLPDQAAAPLLPSPATSVRAALKGLQMEGYLQCDPAELSLEAGTEANQDDCLDPLLWCPLAVEPPFFL